MDDHGADTDSQAAPVIREVVGVLHDRDSIERAIAELAEAGFAHSDVSLLSSHEPVEAAEPEGRRWGDVVVGLSDEIHYVGPLAAAGFIAVASGPVGALLAGLIAAGIGGVAVKELLDDVTATPHTEDFARALEAGSVIVWVRTPDAGAEETAREILSAHGGEDIHVNERRE